MEFKLLGKEKDKAKFLIKNVDNTYVNTLRRIIIDYVPTLAIDEVKFIKNTSALYDEIIAHRLGLIVLKTDKTFDYKAKGKAFKEVMFKLKESGPKTVYAESLKCTDPKIRPVFPRTPIVKLAKDHVLDIEAKAILGIGKEHSKFSPGLVYFNAYPKITINKPNMAQEAIKVCPKNVFKMANNKVNVEKLENCDLCMACVEACGEEIIKVVGSKEDFIFYFEPWGQLKSNEMMDMAIEVFNDKLDELEKEIKKI